MHKQIKKQTRKTTVPQNNTCSLEKWMKAEEIT